MSRFLYQPFYCEENIWHLAGHPDLQGSLNMVIVISNPQHRFTLWGSRAADLGQPVIWDYHVILGAKHGDGWSIWDPDCALGMPLDAESYLKYSFRDTGPGSSQPLFRIIEANLYRLNFASDRAHMRQANGSYIKPLPPWPAIAEDRPSTLTRILNFGDSYLGPVITYGALRSLFRSSGPAVQSAFQALAGTMSRH